MRIISFFSLTFLLFVATLSYAGGGGLDEYATEKEVRQKSSEAIASIIQKGKIDSSWGEIEPNEVKEKMGKSGLYEWTLTYINPEILEEKKKTLYVFVNTSGQVLRVNFSGN